MRGCTNAAGWTALGRGSHPSKSTTSSSVYQRATGRAVWGWTSGSAGMRLPWPSSSRSATRSSWRSTPVRPDETKPSGRVRGVRDGGDAGHSLPLPGVGRSISSGRPRATSPPAQSIHQADWHSCWHAAKIHPPVSYYSESLHPARLRAIPISPSRPEPNNQTAAGTGTALAATPVTVILKISV